MWEASLTLQAGFVGVELDSTQILRWYQSLSKIHLGHASDVYSWA